MSISSEAGRDAYPRQSARTRRFTLGRPRSFSFAADGSRIAFLRSTHGEDTINRLWAIDLPDGQPRLVVDPGELGEGGELPAEERARRERQRELAGGITAYAVDRDLGVAAFALGGRLYSADLRAGGARLEPAATDGVTDPRPSRGGDRIAYAAKGRLHVVEAGADRMLAGDGEPDGVTWGAAEFIAAEEMGRGRGFWWAPEGLSLAATRVDVRGVSRWYIADPAQPASEPLEVSYPAAGTDNAVVTLHVIDLDGHTRQVQWDQDAYPYLARVRWGVHLGLLVQSRDQRRTRLLVADPATGETATVHERRDEHWVDLVDGAPAWLDDGRIVTTVDDGDTRRLEVDGRPVTPHGLQIRQVLDVGPHGVIVAASEDPTQLHVYRVDPDGGDVVALTSHRGVHAGAAGGGMVVTTSSVLEEAGTVTMLHAADGSPTLIESFEARPPLVANVRMLELGPRRLRCALLLPHDPPAGPLPVLLDPYGGPHALRVLATSGAHLTSQWFAEHGFAVLVVDGRGTPGRGPAWERAVHRDLAGPVLEDQVEALQAAAEVEPLLDLTRVGIRGWSFGGYLAALAVLRRPDVFHAAVAGAPVTDWRLYDTHYTERYLGHPHEDPDAYLTTSLVEAASAATGPARPLLIVHGLADDNVVVAHSLRLSQALLEAGRMHTVLPLSGVTHMTPQEVVAENLLNLQREFLQGALRIRS